MVKNGGFGEQNLRCDLFGIRLNNLIFEPPICPRFVFGILRMKNINVIFTIHKCNGACNSDALHEIIKLIKPDIIFEELSLANFDDFYNKRRRNSLETDAIKKYLRNHDIKHIPIDTYSLPEKYEDKQDYLLDVLINKNILQESFELERLILELEEKICLGGFHFLNSDANNEVLDKFEILKGQLLNKINDLQLFSIAEMDKNVIDKREDEIINNIYNYSKENQYFNALLFMGSGHRRAMMQKVENLKDQKGFKINWIFHNYKKPVA